MGDIPTLDLKRKYHQLYNPSPKEVTIVDVPAFGYLMVDGQGDPNTAKEYRDAVNTLYSVAYTLKFMIKKYEQPVDYGVMALEGLWWSDNMNTFSVTCKDDWKWTMMIMQPDFINQDWVIRATAEAARKRELPALAKLRFECFAEGLSAQMMHLGPYVEEESTVLKIHSYITTYGYQLRGRHHEIYLNDPNKVAPARLKTIIRQPIVLKDDQQVTVRSTI